MSQSSTYVWAIDPFSEKAIQLKIARHLKEFMARSSNKVEPTAVLNPGQLRIPMDAPDVKSQFKLAAQGALAKITKAVKIPNLLPPSFVFSQHYSQRKSIETFLDFAKEKKAELIVLGTHARSGMQRWLLGSFAESLILHSDIPLLVVNPKVHKPQKIKTVLFPTDLSPASERGLRKLMPTLERLKANLILYHKMDYVIPETYSMIYRTDIYEKYLKDDEKNRHTQLEKWSKMLTEKGIKCDIVIDEKPSFIPKAIVAAAKKHKVQMIALVSHTGPTSAVFLGSIARQVVRSADCPIWSWHTRDKA